ncbi:hypothetical protein MUP01_12135 [Candidatus Bathyarchaeota archaeon]|nr:hypothetical protein [Candidatus Bathyarchaeota archaeon]
MTHPPIRVEIDLLYSRPNKRGVKQSSHVSSFLGLMQVIRRLMGDWKWDLKYGDGEREATILVNNRKIGEVVLKNGRFRQDDLERDDMI